MYVVALALVVPVVLASGVFVGLWLAAAVRAAGSPAGAARRMALLVLGVPPRLATWAERQHLGPIASVERSRATGARR